MPIFKYEALARDKKTITGMVEANSRDYVEEMLKEKGYSIVTISLLPDIKKSGLNFFNRVKNRDIVIFSRQFSVLISANVAMVQALKVLVDQTSSLVLKTIISDVADEVDAGSPLSEALGQHPNVFGNFYVSVIKSGETSGKLDEVLSYLADEMEKDYDMMSKIKGAMIYPAFVLFALGVVGAVMMIFVVPKLTNILTESGTELPLTTRLLIGTSGFMAKFWWLLIIIIVGAFLAVRAYIRKPQGKKQLDFIKLKLPIFGRLFQLIYLVRFTRSMNTLIAGGVTISNGLKVTAEVVGNTIYQELIEQTVKEVEDGNSISSVFINSDTIPKMVSQMLSIGEKTGRMDIILEKITDFYGREISTMVDNLMTLMEPIIMVIMGVAVGIMVAAIILPMYNMASNF